MVMRNVSLGISGRVYMFMALFVLTAFASLVGGCLGEEKGLIPESAYLKSDRQLQAADPLFPESTANVGSRFEGAPNLPLIFVVGEDHVAPAVQEQVASLLGYLHRAFDVSLIGAEGFDESLPESLIDGPWTVKRAVARSELLGRRFGGLEYAALVYSDLRVVGVSDLAAYEEHGEALSALEGKAEELVGDFQKFLMSDLTQLRVTSEDKKLLEEALAKALAEGDWSIFDRALIKSQGIDSPVRREMLRLAERREELQEESDELVSPDHPVMRERDQRLVVGVLEALRGETSAALVVGKLHVPGVERELRRLGVSYVTLLPVGLDAVRSDEERAGDYMVYKERLGEEKTKLEKWLSLRRYRSPLLLAPYQQRLAVLGALFNVNYMVRQGRSEEQIHRLTGNVNLPVGLTVKGVFSVGESSGNMDMLSGYMVEFAFRGESARIYFTGREMEFDPNAVLANGMADDEVHYVIVSESELSALAEEATHVALSGNGSNVDDRDLYMSAVKRQQEEYPEAVSIAFFVEDGSRIIRYVGQERRDLFASENSVRELVRSLDRSADAEKVEVARRVSEILLADIEEDLPSRFTVVNQIFEENILGNWALPYLAAIGGHPSAKLLEAATEVRSMAWPGSVESEASTVQGLVDLMSTPSPRARFDTIVVWLSKDLEANSDFAAVLEDIRETGVRVNEAPNEGDSLILVGVSEREAGINASISLVDSLQSSQTVVAMNWLLQESLLSDVDGSLQIQVDPEQGPRKVLEILRRLRRSNGKESLDQAVRSSAARESREILNLFTKKEADAFGGRVESVIAQNATVYTGV